MFFPRYCRYNGGNIFWSILRMQNRISVYLSGSVVKGKKEQEHNVILWGDTEIEELISSFTPYQVDFLNPSERNDDLSISDSIVGRDLMQVYFSDFILVDAREKRGVGVGAEMMFANMHGIPVVTIAPVNTHYHKDTINLLGQEIDNWKHPFIDALSQHTADSLQAAVDWIKIKIPTLNRLPVLSVKQDRFFYFINFYLETQLERDRPMLQLFEKNPKLMEKKNRFLQMYKGNENQSIPFWRETKVMSADTTDPVVSTPRPGI
jgi:hypothetical protein